MTTASTTLSETAQTTEERHSRALISGKNTNSSLESPPPLPKTEETAKAVALLEDPDQRLAVSDAEVAKRKAAFDARIAATLWRMKASCEQAAKHSAEYAVSSSSMLLDRGAAFLADYSGGAEQQRRRRGG